mmetsp:Transcript_3755/g.5922  ORF Transcript_3755/g.5922 Transcript_3755/m.5922 type:complete len:143 (+) Transcript_3755:1519-1947(+)
MLRLYQRKSGPAAISGCSFSNWILPCHRNTATRRLLVFTMRRPWPRWMESRQQMSVSKLEVHRRRFQNEQELTLPSMVRYCLKSHRINHQLLHQQRAENTLHRPSQQGRYSKSSMKTLLQVAADVFDNAQSVKNSSQHCEGQ